MAWATKVDMPLNKETKKKPKFKKWTSILKEPGTNLKQKLHSYFPSLYTKDYDCEIK